MNLIIDGNAFVNVAISVTKASNSRDRNHDEVFYVNDLFNDDSYILKESIKLSFRNFCFTYLNSLIYPLGSSLDTVHIVFDSRSWRKDYVSDFFQSSDFATKSAPSEFTYKGTRKTDSMHYLFFDYFHTLTDALANVCGVNIHKVAGTEGDDIIAYLCDTVDDDIAIYSVDQDMKQLVTSVGKNVMLMMPKQMHKFKRLFIPKTFSVKPKVEEDDFFSLDDSMIASTKIDQIVATLEKKGYTALTTDNVPDIMSKVLLGDKSDNIPKIKGITPTKFTKLLDKITDMYSDDLIQRLDRLDEDLILSIVTEIGILNKLKDPSQLAEVRDHLIFNIIVMRLSVSVMPPEIKQNLISWFDKFVTKPFSMQGFTSLKNNLSTL